jgi:hypothetical protein
MQKSLLYIRFNALKCRATKKKNNCDKKLGHKIIKTRNTYIKWQSHSKNYPLALSL